MFSHTCDLQVPHYLGGQYLGAFLASATVFLVYWDALVWYEHDRGGYRQAFRIFVLRLK